MMEVAGFAKRLYVWMQVPDFKYQKKLIVCYERSLTLFNIKFI